MNWWRYFIKAGVHGALGLGGSPARARSRLKGSLVVLTYHSFSDDWPTGGVSSLPVRQFERQLQFLKAAFHVVSLRDGLAALARPSEADRPMVAITIDDGFRDNFTHAFPLLRKYCVPATIFLATDFLDSGRPPWPTRIVTVLDRTRRTEMTCPFSASLRSAAERSTAVRRLMDMWGRESPEVRMAAIDKLADHLGVEDAAAIQPLTWQQVRDMRSEGIEFGSHTVFHSRLHESERGLMQVELARAKARIEAELGGGCDYFAYPDGKWNAIARQAVRDAGYRAALTQDTGCNGPENTDLFALRRVEIPFHDPLSTFRWRTSIASRTGDARP